jgi:7-carboxy-7-deazaguanine synthase
MLVSKMPSGKPEIFQSFQGEGATIGEPCVFVRLAGCNLQCSFCDTAYTWLFDKSKSTDYFEPMDRNDYVINLDTASVVRFIKEYAGEIRRVVFTGGEPLLQQKDIYEVMETLKEHSPDWEFEVETNGTMFIEKSYMFDRVNCSPKLSSSGNAKNVRDVGKVIQQYMAIARNYESVIFKFVVGADTSEADLKEIKEWQDEYNVPTPLIYLMPEGIEVEKIKKGMEVLLKISKKEGYKLSPRVHILTYGNTRAT